MGADFPLTQSHATIFSLRQTLNCGTYKFHLCATPKLLYQFHTVRDWSTLNPRYQSVRIVDSLRSYQDRAVLLQSTPKHLLRTSYIRLQCWARADGYKPKGTLTRDRHTQDATKGSPLPYLPATTNGRPIAIQRA